MWFDEIAANENPNIIELRGFVNGVTQFLKFVLDDKSFLFLWNDDKELHRLALETFEGDVLVHSRLLLAQIEIPSPSLMGSLIEHGLIGRPMKFKLRVLNFIAKQWERVRGQFTIREWLKRMFDAIDAILDSLIDAAGAIGSVIKEFKDALSALVSSDKGNGGDNEFGGDSPKSPEPKSPTQESHGKKVLTKEEEEACDMSKGLKKDLPIKKPFSFRQKGKERQ